MLEFFRSAFPIPDGIFPDGGEIGDGGHSCLSEGWNNVDSGTRL